MILGYKTILLFTFYLIPKFERGKNMQDSKLHRPEALIIILLPSKIYRTNNSRVTSS